MSRYVLFPGEVISKQDGDRHYIGVGQLRSLYHVPPHAHVLVVAHDDRRFYRHLPGDIICRPLYSGDYPTALASEEAGSSPRPQPRGAVS